MRTHRTVTAALVSLVAACLWAGAAAAEPLKLNKGDHVALVGNTLADRMQHFGWMETLIYSRFPDQELVFRDLGFSGDEVDFKKRERNDNFGSPNVWLERVKADVVFGFFGYNESFAGEAGVAKFKEQLTAWVKHTQGQEDTSPAARSFEEPAGFPKLPGPMGYSRKGPARVVLFSPIAYEKLDNPDLPDGVALNKQIKLYADAVAEVAKAENVPFVDLFGPSQELYRSSDKPLTVNGIHMTEYGDERLAPVIVKQLFGDAAPAKDSASLEKLRQAVNEKNFYFFEHYRTLDGYNIYGGRSKMKYKQVELDNKEISNLEVMSREMEVLDVMAANRDKRVQAVAQGKDFTVDDSNTPPFVEVKTNLPGKGPNGTHIYQGGEEAIKDMKVGKGMKVNLFADEKMFPDLMVNPVQMSFDDKGRLWVACWNAYPRWRAKEEMKDKILILEDTDGDGKADKCTVFMDHLNCPTGFEFYRDGIILAQAPGILFCRDTNGDGKADQVERMLEGFDSADSHHTSNSFTYGPGGDLYWQEGTFMHSQIETLDGPIRASNGSVWRFEPRTFRFDTYTSYGFANPHGHVFDKWGTDIVIDGTGAQPYYGPSFTGKVYFPQKHPKAPQVYKQRTRPCPGGEILSSPHFPDEMQGNFLVLNVIGVRGILQYKLTEKGAGLVGTELEPIVTSEDPNFRPSDAEIAPDGSLYFLDWQNAIIGHLQHHIRDPNRDHEHGRVYRVTYEGRPLVKPAPVAGQSIDALLELLKNPENRVRYRAKIELGGRDTKQVIAATEKWIAALDKNDPNYEHNRLEGLWVYQWHNVINEPLLRQVLKSPDHHARAAAARVLCYWRDRVKNALDLVKQCAMDEHPRVRLEAVRTCSFYTDAKAADVALEVLNKESNPDKPDEFIKYALDETLKTLEKHAK